MRCNTEPHFILLHFICFGRGPCLQKSLLKFANDVSYVLAALHEIQLWPTLALPGTHTHTHMSVGQKFIIARRIILINYAREKYALLSKVCHEFCAILRLAVRVFLQLLHWRQRLPRIPLSTAGTFLIRGSHKRVFLHVFPQLLRFFSYCQRAVDTPLNSSKNKK